MRRNDLVYVMFESMGFFGLFFAMRRGMDFYGNATSTSSV